MFIYKDNLTYYSPLSWAIAQDDLQLVQLLLPKFKHELNLLSNSSLFDRFYYSKKAETMLKYDMQGLNYALKTPTGVFTRYYYKVPLINSQSLYEVTMETPLMRACVMGT